MKKFFKYIRRQPKNVRDQYALLFSGVFVLLVVALWLPTHWGDTETEVAVEVTDQKEMPFKTLFKSIKDQFASVMTSVNNDLETVDQEQVETTNVYQGSAKDFVLSEEEITALKQKIEEVGADISSSESGSFQEVLIATTSATSSLKTEVE